MILACLLVALSVHSVPPGQAGQEDAAPQTSGRPMPPEQACFDVLHYRLEVTVDPEERSIAGRLTMRAQLLAAHHALELDLDDRLRVDDVQVNGRTAAEFHHRGGVIWISLRNRELAVGAEFEVRVDYHGVPRVAPRPPWDGGFVWARTADGSHWIATANQMQGADLWWPCKDQPSDEPESMDILVTVPSGLVCASNGRLVRVRAEGDESTYHWRVSTPINAYGVALNIAPYRTISRSYTSVTGESFPITYWVLPENLERGRILFEDIVRQVRFFEETFGPYPFRADKYGVAETPHLGMEHQSIIAYGNEYRGNPWGADRGFDFLHHHELAHEWWANLVTCRNWKDFWIHESFATYAQALYVEQLHGAEALRGTLAEHRAYVQNLAAVAPRGDLSTGEVHSGGMGTDIYYKGSCILHSLRWLIGDEVFLRALRRMAYPDPDSENTTDGSACRFTDTEEIRSIAERVSRRDLDWFFELYLRQPQLPRLVSSAGNGVLQLRWETPGDLPFPMPVEVRVGAELVRVEMEHGRGEVALDGADYAIDPNAWILRAE